MLFKSTGLLGVYEIHIEKHIDSRGYFARTWCKNEFSENNLEFHFVQNSIAYNYKKGTLRGMHYQSEEMKQTKIIQCSKGSAFVVVADLRRTSQTYGQYSSYELTGNTHIQLYIPTGIALGYQTLTDGTEMIYQMTKFYDPDQEHGFRWNDPAFHIVWPDSNPILLERDNSYPDYNFE